ncbi:transcription termination factor 3, mitochondrial-like [Pecten maximus]|uniref:transcription termination factor 3, mitochondrial-like n=1 Tax=Pecten maximus TaxID=6579 RepID=UPI0014582EF3|nr:transcription termination factor 3, mitochondrial-like [Pecten maximus]
MAACRLSSRLGDSLRKVYGRSTNVCDLCWQRSLNIGSSSQKNELHKLNDEKVMRSSAPPLTPEGGHYLSARGLYTNSIFKAFIFDMAKSTKLSCSGKPMIRTSVLWLNYFSGTRLKLNSNLFCGSRHFCSAEFRRDLDNTAEMKEDLGADSDTQEMDETVGEMLLNVSNHGDQQVISKPLDVYDYSTRNQDSQLPGTTQPAPPLPFQSYNLAPFIAKSDVLKYLLHLNVNLAKVEAKRNAASSLVKLDLKQDVMPVMFFLKEAEIPDDKLGKVIGLYPFIFEKFDEAKLMMEYFKLKKFKKESIAHIIVGAPTVLGLQVVTTDTRIGAYQKFFNLTGDQTRQVMTRVPRILLNHPDVLKETIEMFRAYGFSKDQLKNILLQCPSVFKRPEEDNLKHRLQYLLMNIPMDHNTITKFSYVLRYPTNPIKERHLFLLELGRAQYDPTKENYISPTDLVCSPESKFCQLARTTPALFREFKTTL